MLAIKLIVETVIFRFGRHSSQIGYVFHDSLAKVSWCLDCKRVERRNISYNNLQNFDAHGIPSPSHEGKERGGGETYTCTYRHRSGLDIAWVRCCALSRYTPDTAYHDFYPSIKTKGSISSFCTVPRLRWRILRSSLYTYIYVNNPVGSRCAHSRIIYVFRIRVVHVYHAFRLRVYFSRVDVGASWKISMHHICIYIYI